MTTPLTELADERASRVARRLAGVAGLADEHAPGSLPIMHARAAAAGVLAVAALLALVAARGSGAGERNPVRELAAAGSLSGTPQADLHARQRVPTRDAPELPVPERGSSSTMKIQSTAAIAATILTASANCADIRVPQDVATIQGAIDAAQAGDRVLVGPGTYYEQVNLGGKRIQLIGVAGAASTILDGENVRTVMLGANEPAGCEVSGFTIRNGNGAISGGVSIANSAARFHHCVFSANRAWDLWGGAAFRSAGGSASVEDCQFMANIGVDQSTSSAWYHFGAGAFSLVRCVFDANIGNAAGPNGGDSGGVVAKVNREFTQGSVGEIRDCIFIDQRTGDPTPSFWGPIVIHAAHGEPVTIGDCKFVAATGGQNFVAWATEGSRVEISNCNGCGFDAVLLTTSGASGTVTSSAFSATCPDCNSNGIPDIVEFARGTAQDSNSNGQIDSCECAADPSLPFCCASDLNRDGRVDGADLSSILAFWGPTGTVLPAADLNRDGRVDGYDLSIVLAHWGPCSP